MINIKTLKEMFPFPVAFSDHTPGNQMDIAAVALGANMVEKTITEDRMTRSVEHIMSIEPEEMKSFVKIIRETEIGLGIGRREMTEEEINKRVSLRRSAFLLKAAKKGQRLSDCKIEFRRPGFGINPDQFEQISNSILARDLESGQIINFTDLL